MAWNGSDNGKAKVEGQGKAKAKGQGNSSLITPRSSLKRAALAGTLVVLGGALALYLVLGRAPAPEPAAPQKAPPKKSAPVKLVLPPTNVVEVAEKPVQKVYKNEYEKRFHDEKITSIVTNGTGYVIVEAIQPNGRPVRHIVQPPTIFEKATDELIMVALTVPEGQVLPPLPNLGGSRADVEFLKSLDTPIRDLPDDSDETRAYKQIVRDARDEIKARIDAGEHFADILADHQRLHNENSKIRSGAVSELQSIVDAGDEEGAKRYLNVMNAAFSQMGISPIDMPEKTEDRIMRIFSKDNKNKEN